MWYVTTDGGYRIGPYDSYDEAFDKAVLNFGMEGWVITHT